MLGGVDEVGDIAEGLAVVALHAREVEAAIRAAVAPEMNVGLCLGAFAPALAGGDGEGLLDHLTIRIWHQVDQGCASHQVRVLSDHLAKGRVAFRDLALGVHQDDADRRFLEEAAEPFLRALQRLGHGALARQIAHHRSRAQASVVVGAHHLLIDRGVEGGAGGGLEYHLAIAGLGIAERIVRRRIGRQGVVDHVMQLHRPLLERLVRIAQPFHQSAVGEEKAVRFRRPSKNRSGHVRAGRRSALVPRGRPPRPAGAR